MKLYANNWKSLFEEEKKQEQERLIEI